MIFSLFFLSRSWLKAVLLSFALVYSVSVATAMERTETFVYSGGCFWCTEADSEKLHGVVETISGFTGGSTTKPKYTPGGWGDHREAAQVIYKPDVISFADLVRHVYATVDYEDNEGQFCDRGHSYSPAIYVKNDEQAAIAKRLAPPTSVIPIEMESAFYPVRDSHQDFYKKRGVRYKAYRFSCGRDRRLSTLNDG
jgi:peptide-methionine (S)-S-oxide reductase